MPAFSVRRGFLAIVTLLMIVGCGPVARNAAEGPGRIEEGSNPLHDLPCLQCGEFRAAPYLAAAIHLQKLGKDKAVASLAEMTRDGAHNDEFYILCRMLFVPQAGDKFRCPSMGSASFLGKTTATDWPLEPIEIVDGIPFCVVWGYSLSEISRPDVYLNYCVEQCVWNNYAYGPKSDEEKQAALEKLLKSSKWQGNLEAIDRDYLESQIK